MSKMTYELNEGVALITLNDGKANAMNHDFFDELNANLDIITTDDAQVVIFNGRPGFFSAGLDLKLVPTLGPPELFKLIHAFGSTISRVYTLPIPTIAACNGHAIAGGAILAMACDLRFFQDGPFKLQMSEVAIGMQIPTWMLEILRSAIPVRWQTEFILHAREFSPVEALECQLVHGVAASEEDVVALARKAIPPLLRLNQQAYRITKSLMRQRVMDQALELLPTDLNPTA